MFLFPLGLKAKTRQFPTATVAVIIVTVIYSVMHLAELDRMTIAISDGPAVSELVPARNRIAIANCIRLAERLRITAEDCEFLKSILNTEDPQRYQQFVSETKATLESRLSGEDAHKIASFEKLLFSDEFWLENKAEFTGEEEFQQYLSRRDEVEKAQMRDEHDFLSLENLSIRSLTDSNLAHAGWLHLVINMAFLLFLAIAVEERIGSFTFLAVYVLAGLVGNLTHLTLSTQFAEILPQKQWQVLLGASGNVAGTAGIYIALFWKLEVRLWSYRRKLGKGLSSVPVVVFVPLFFITFFVLGVLVGGENDGVISYLGGVGFGVLVGLICRWLRPVHADSVFPFEDRLIKEAEAASTAEEKLSRLAEVLYHHPENRSALDLALVTVLQEAVVPWEALETKIKRFIKRNFEGIFFDRLKRDSASEFVEFAAAIPSDWPLEEILKKIEFSSLQPIVALCQTQGRFELAVRLLRVLCGLTDGRLRTQLEQYLSSVEKEIVKSSPAA
jgi:membrane associated rhomboid family serine protease